MNVVLAALANGAILGSILTAALWLVLRLTPRRVLNAATRYAMWWALLLVVMALPLFYLPRPAYRFRAKPATIAAPPVHVATPAIPPHVSLSVPPVFSPRPASESLPQAAPRFPIRIVTAGWPRWVLASWAAVSLLLLVRLAASFVLLGRASRRASDVPLRLSGTTRSGVRLAASSDIAIPVAVGPWRPAILMPVGLIEELGEQELEQIVLHEAAHLERRDDYALLLQRVVEAIFSLHPVVRWIARRIDLEREVACDDRVIAITGRARLYATCLTRVVEWSCGVKSSLVAAAAGEDSSQLARRVDMLLDKTRHTGTQLLKARLTAIVAVVVALAWLAGRSPGFVAFASPLVRTLREAPARILPHTALLPSAAETPQPATPRFQGRVLEDSSGAPLASAEIRLRKSGMRELVADLDTDRNGKAFAGLAEGEYSIEVLKPNFVTASLKVHVPVEDFTVRLVRYGIISGQINTQNGRPAPDTIHAPGGRSVGGTRVAILVKDAGGQLQVLREASLGEEGQYRIHDLTPGQYAIGVWYDGLEDGSGVQLYPDNARPRFFTVSGGEEYDHIDFLLPRQAVFSVSGKIEGAKKGDHYALSLGAPDQPVLPVARTLSDADGSFRFARVPVGTYDLMAGGPSRGYGQHDDLLGANSLFGRIRIQVGQNIEGLSIPLSAGRTLKVALRSRAGDTPPPGCPQSANVLVEPLEAWGLIFNNNDKQQVAFGKEGEVTDLPPGRFRLSATNLSESCFQTAPVVADLASESSSPVSIELAQAGSIRGTVGVAAHPGEFAVLLLDAAGSPDSPAQVAHADAQGHFAFDSLRPGRYRIGAQVASGAATSRWVADVSRLVVIEVSAGAPTQVDLPAPARQGAQ